MIVNVSTHLARLAGEEPDREAIIISATGAGRTFKQLHDDSDRVAHALRGIGIIRGLRTALMVPPSLEFFTLTFALFKIGAVPVLIDPGMGIRNLGTCLAEAEPAAFIGIPKAHLARKLLGWAKQSLCTTVTTGKLFAQFSLPTLLKAPPTGSTFPMAATTADETAAILFTSGSTGVAKGVVYTHGIFAAQIDMLRQMYGIEPGEVDLSTFPLFALFGPALGMTAVVPDMNPTKPAQVDPRKIIGAIEKYRVTNMFGSPALVDRVGTFLKEKGIKLPSLKRVISAGAPVPAHAVERFATALSPGVQVHTPYGATESLPVASIGNDELKETRAATEAGCGVCVGRPVPPMQVRIIPISDEPIALWDQSQCLGTSAIGEIVVNGPVVSRSYFNRPRANELAKMIDPATGDVWHRMGDLGYFDSLGRLWFCGRKSQRVVTSRGTLHTAMCEGVFNRESLRTALVGVVAFGDVQPVLCCEFIAWPDGRPDTGEITLRHPHTSAIRKVLRHSKFPVDVRHNSKIFREKLAVWATRQLRHHQWEADTTPIVAAPTFDEWRAAQ